MTAYIKKEWMELTRTGKLLILGIIFILIGILNPAMAKLTPWLYEMMEETLKESGLSLGEVKVNAMTSWTQFFKNFYMVLIAMILMYSTSFVNEYQKGTLIQVITKGLSRKKVFFAKLLVSYGIWTALYMVYTGVTFGYTVYFWGGEGINNLFFSIFMLWLLGMAAVSLLAMFGAMFENSGQVLLGTAGFLVLTVFLGYIPVLKKLMPMRLADGLELVNGTSQPKDFLGTIILASILAVVCAIIGMFSFDRRKL